LDNEAQAYFLVHILLFWIKDDITRKGKISKIQIDTQWILYGDMEYIMFWKFVSQVSESNQIQP